MRKLIPVEGIGPVAVVFTTPAWRAGADAAQDLHRQAPDCTPLWSLIDRRGPEFADGFATRWADLHPGA